MPCVCARTRTSSRCTTISRRSRHGTRSRLFDAESQRRREEPSKSKPENAEEAEAMRLLPPTSFCPRFFHDSPLPPRPQVLTLFSCSFLREICASPRRKGLSCLVPALPGQEWRSSCKALSSKSVFRSEVSRSGLFREASSLPWASKAIFTLMPPYTAVREKRFS